MSQETKILNATLSKELGAMRAALQAVAEKESGYPILESLLKALRGDDGKTPEKGVDYFTEEDINAFMARVEREVVKPQRGKHYWTKEDVKFIVDSTYKMVKIPKVGKDFYTRSERRELVDDVMERVSKLMTKEVEAFMKKGGSANMTITKAAGENGPKFIVGDGIKKITVAARAPVSPVEGDLWIKVV